MQSKGKRSLTAATLASLLITSSVAAINVKAASVTPPESPRLWGENRYETATKVSQNGWTTSDYAIIASGEVYADALCAAPLAKVNNAPILLTTKNTLDSKTLDELKRLQVKHVYIVGGQGAVSQAVEDKIKSDVTTDVQRLWGQDRYETSVKVAEKLPASSKVVLASGQGYADALSAAPVAAIEGMPILLTESKNLSKPTADYIKTNTNITSTFVIGGSGVVNDSVMNQMLGAQRIGGSDRYETNKLVIERFSSDFNYNNVYTAIGDGPIGNEFADALSASALAAKNRNPLIITGKTLSSYTDSLIKSKLKSGSTLTILGGVANISDEFVVNTEKIIAALTSGGSSGGSSSTIATLGQAGTYNNNISGDAVITADNVTLTGNVTGDLHINANNATVSGITVGGTLYINPGSQGDATIENVTAANIVVQSGADHTIKLKGVKANKLTVDLSGTADDSVNIESSGDTEISATDLKSTVILNALSGSFGTITIPGSLAVNTVALKGSFNRPIIIEGNVNIDTDATVVIPSIIIPEGINADGIKLKGNGNIANIQIRSISSVLNIDGTIVLTGTISAVDKNSVTSDSNTIILKVEEKAANDMTDITAYKDITSDIVQLYGEKMKTYLSSHETLGKYLAVNTTGTAIEFKVNTSAASISEMFASAKAESFDTFVPRLRTVQDLLDMNFVSKTAIDGKTIKDYLQEIYPSSFDTNGMLLPGVVWDNLRNDALTYDTFKGNLMSKIEGTDKTAVGPALSFKLDTQNSLNIDTIEKDGVVVYNKTWTREKNVQFLNKNNISDLVGNYTIYSGNNYIKVNLVK